LYGVKSGINESIEQLISRVNLDAAMYEAKAGVHNRVHSA
jgi:hypothetical protein